MEKVIPDLQRTSKTACNKEAVAYILAGEREG